MTVRLQSASKKILLIDDSVVDLKVLIEMLSKQSFSLHVAFSGPDGVQKAELLMPDLILLDVTMPKVDGFATCRQLKSSLRTQSIPVIFLTAATELDRRVEGLTVGGVDYITKPFFPQEVIARILVHLELSRVSREQQEGVYAVNHRDVGVTLTRSGKIVRAALKVLRSSISEPPSSHKLAKMLGTNERALVAAFQEEFALTVSDWLREERMQTAKHLLVTTDTSIQSISEYIGFSNQANFSKAFRARYGLSPREARQASFQKNQKTIEDR
jgi:DNA-binding response OmpR family regulator